MATADVEPTANSQGRSFQAPPFLARVLGGPTSAPLFRGTAVLLAPDAALTCRHVIEGTDPFGRPSREPLPEILIETTTGRRIAARPAHVEHHRDLALLMLDEPVEIDAPVMLAGLTRRVESRLRAQPLFLFGFAESDPHSALWMHGINYRMLFCSYRGADEVLTQVQLSGGVPAGCSGGAIALPRRGGGWFYAGSIYLGGEASATSRAIMADSVADFLADCGLIRVTRIAAGDALLATSITDTCEEEAEHTLPPNPYRGLAVFREADAGLLFGRDRERERLVAAVAREHTITVIGASGIGKSSLVFAGLVPRLRDMGGWTILAFRPRSDPAKELAAALAAVLSDGMDHDRPRRDPCDLARQLTADENAMAVIVRGLEQRLAGDQRLLVIVDQMEELLAADLPAAARRDFVAALSGLVQASGRCTLLMVLRVDFLARALEDQPLAAIMEAGCHFIVPPIAPRELEAVIAEPARLRGVHLEAGLADRIIGELDGAPGALPLLQFTLARMWERQRCRQITHEAYSALGGIREGFVRYAEDVIAQLDVEEDRLRRIFLRLVRSGEDGVDSRQTVNQEQFRPEDGVVIQRLIDARLLVTTQDASGADGVELVHEALIRHWARLRSWLQHDARFRLWHARLLSAANDWRRHNEDPGALLRGPRLAEAEDWLREYAPRLGASDCRFIAASQALSRTEIARQRRSRRLVTAALLSGLVLFGALAGWAAIQRRAAVIARDTAEGERAAAIAHKLAVASEMALIGAPSELSRAGLLAVESLKRAWTVEGRTAWTAAMRLLPPRPVRLAHDDEVTDVAFSPGGDKVASASWDGTLRLWNAASGEEIFALRHEGKVRALAFSSDGSRVASVAGGAVYLWNVATGDAIFRSQLGGELYGVAFAPGDSGILVASSDGRATLCDATTGGVLRTLDHGAPVWNVVSAPDGKALITIAADRVVQLWDAATGGRKRSIDAVAPVRAVAFLAGGVLKIATGSGDILEIRDPEPDRRVTKLAHPGEILAAAFGPDAATIVSAGDDGFARLWNASSGRLVAEMRHDFAVASVRFSPDGRSIATASGDRTARVWDARTGKERLRLSHPGVVRAAEFSPDGNRLVTRSADDSAWLWAVKPYGEPSEVVLDQPPSDVLFAPGGRSIAIRDADGNVVVRRFADGTQFALAGHAASLSFDASGQLLATAGTDGNARVWDIATGEEGFQMPHGESVYAVAVSADASHLMTADKTGRVRLWALSDPPRGLLEIETDGIWSISLSPHASRLAMLDRKGGITLYDARNARRIAKLAVGDTAWGLGFTSDGKRLFAVDGVHSVLIWSAANGRMLMSLDHDEEVRSVGTGAGGRLAAATANGAVSVWDSETGRRIDHFTHNAAVEDLAFNAPADRLAVALADRTVHLRDISTSTELARFHVGAPLAGVAFAGNGDHLLAASSAASMARVPLDRPPTHRIAEPLMWALALPAPVGTSGSVSKVDIFRWPYTIGGLIAEACSRLPRNLNLQEWETYLPGEAKRPTCPGLRSQS